MFETRSSVPRAVKKRVLKSFNGRCAACGRRKPRLFFIDGNLSHPTEENLLPLCGRDHLFDPHNPSVPLAAGRLSLLRQFHDPSVLKPQFQAIYRRLQFLEGDLEDARLEDLAHQADELVNFLVSLEMGVFYGGQIHQLLQVPPLDLDYGAKTGVTVMMARAEARQEEQFRTQLLEARERVFGLCVEMLRFQNWE